MLLLHWSTWKVKWSHWRDAGRAEGRSGASQVVVQERIHCPRLSVSPCYRIHVFLPKQVALHQHPNALVLSFTRQSSAHWLLFILDLTQVFLFFVGNGLFFVFIRLDVGLPQFSNRILFAHQIYSLCRTLFYTVSLFTFVACLQERVEDRWTASTECCDSAPLPQEVESSTASSSVSSRAESPFARCSKCPTLASSYVVLPVLLWQMNNQGYIHSKGSKQYQVTCQVGPKFES